MFEKEISLKDFSNYKIGGPARHFYVPKTLEDLMKGVEKAKSEKTPIFIMGGGTNLLISDEGFKGVVIKPQIMTLEKTGETTIRVGAGVSMADLLNFAINQHLSGLEWAGGLPGTVGGAIRGNAGAFGGETKDVVGEVVSLDISGDKPAVVRRSGKDLLFGYRNSVYKINDGQEIILEATLNLKKGDQKTIRETTESRIIYRRERHPIEHPNIGSIFKNVDWNQLSDELKKKFESVMKKDPFPVLPTAVLLSEAGLKGVREGGAMFSPKHPNFIVNVENASAADVRKLIDLAKRTVKEKFGVVLEEEVIRVGE